MTFSIIAKCPHSGKLAIGIQTHWFCVGREAIWMEPNYGAIVTQSWVNPNYGKIGLKLLECGLSVGAAMKALLHDDAEESKRQVGMMGFDGSSVWHTGSLCIGVAEEYGENGLICLANIMAKEGVVSSMVASFKKNSNSEIGERILVALEAAQSIGGGLRGRQSSAILIGGDNGIETSLRVDDHREPLAELRRLYSIDRAYKEMNGDCPDLSTDCRDEIMFWRDGVIPNDNAQPWIELKARIEAQKNK